MPAAQNKSDLLAVHHKEFSKLLKNLALVDDDVALIKDDEDTSIKDVIAHRAHWIDLFFGWYTDGLAGKEVSFPAPGYKWNALKAYNRDLRARQASMTWADAKASISAKYDALTTFIEERSEQELYGGPMKGANNHWTPGRWAEAAGPSHFRSATKYVRQRLRAVGKL